MRIIAGALKGRRLKAPTWDGVRPSSDRLRETLFNILAPRMPGARVIDVCAGTGAVGIEALSRGASDVTFIERDRRAQALIAANLAHCGVTTGYAILPTSALEGLEALRGDAAYDAILLDPPYAQDPAETTRMLNAAARLIRPGGIVVLERARRTPAPDLVDGAVHVRDVMSGDSALSFYERPQGR